MDVADEAFAKAFAVVTGVQERLWSLAKIAQDKSESASGEAKEELARMGREFNAQAAKLGGALDDLRGV